MFPHTSASGMGCIVEIRIVNKEKNNENINKR